MRPAFEVIPPASPDPDQRHHARICVWAPNKVVVVYARIALALLPETDHANILSHVEAALWHTLHPEIHPRRGT